MILDNDFLVHHLGLKTSESLAKATKKKKVCEQNALANTIVSDLDKSQGGLLHLAMNQVQTFSMIWMYFNNSDLIKTIFVLGVELI